MTPTECVDLVEFIAGRCPAMRMQANTPQTWYVDLVEFDLTDALEAARVASLGNAFIGIGDLVRECEAIVRRREGQARRAALDAQVAAENAAAVSDRPRPLAALLGGTPIRPAPRGGYDGPSRRVRSGERAVQAQAELERVRPATSDVATAARSSVEEPAVTGDGR